jgi:hypothetical protein
MGSVLVVAIALIDQIENALRLDTKNPFLALRIPAPGTEVVALKWH